MIGLKEKEQNIRDNKAETSSTHQFTSPYTCTSQQQPGEGQTKTSELHLGNSLCVTETQLLKPPPAIARYTLARTGIGRRVEFKTQAF